MARNDTLSASLMCIAFALCAATCDALSRFALPHVLVGALADSALFATLVWLSAWMVLGLPSVAVRMLVVMASVLILLVVPLVLDPLRSPIPMADWPWIAAGRQLGGYFVQPVVASLAVAYLASQRRIRLTFVEQTSCTRQPGRLRFSIRDLLVITTAVAVLLALHSTRWFGPRRHVYESVQIVSGAIALGVALCMSQNRSAVMYAGTVCMGIGLVILLLCGLSFQLVEYVGGLVVPMATCMVQSGAVLFVVGRSVCVY